ncbi:hypothetical protein NBRC10512_004070 [Rhodotorula toruloides]|uniref:RHTO0S03e07756g1_1 n=2 Tax=Rhodotorula toruloides TaxID=5286 RepID=A0A061ASD3_RHOTO|nr:protein of heat shock protein Hsp72 family [Rhodotorula toruloides NP11]EMS25948.1 protein of heat shock protein Hsp72 family [Rhodotorula toruloides NP11]CDR38292.1 RHTO0S03e07756g1_1 [Rhodotorula toruloides]
MVQDAEKFAEEDELLKKKVESRNALESFAYSLKAQLSDSEGLGGKLDSSDKKTIEAEIKKVQDWIDSEGATATAEDFDEQREQLQAAVAPITAKVYSSGAGGDSSSSSGGYHDEL